MVSSVPNPQQAIAPPPLVKDISVWNKYINSDESLENYKRESISGPYQFGDSEFLWGGEAQCDDQG